MNFIVRHSKFAGIAAQAFDHIPQLHHHLAFHTSCSKVAGHWLGLDAALSESTSNCSFTCKLMSTACAWLAWIPTSLSASLSQDMLGFTLTSTQTISIQIAAVLRKNLK
jgi:hypothetical protein